MARVYQRNDSKFWYAEIKIGNKTKRVSTGIPAGIRNKRSAEEAGYKLQEELNAQESGGLSLEDAIVQYLSEADTRESTKRVYGIYLSAILAEYPSQTIGEITPTFCRDLIKHLKDSGKSKHIISMTLTSLKSVMDMAVEERWEGAPEINPVRLISRKSIRVKKDPEAPPRWLQPEVVSKFLEATKGSILHPILILLLETGMRNQEVVRLRWEEVDFQNRCIRLPGARTKSGHPRIVPLTSTALRTLASQVPRSGKLFVFHSYRTQKPIKTIHHQWHRLRDKLGHPTVRIHDIRHTFATWTRETGLDKDTRMDIMGHADENTHDHYSKAQLRTLVQKMEEASPYTMLAQRLLTQSQGKIEKSEKSPNYKVLEGRGSTGFQSVPLSAP